MRTLIAILTMLMLLAGCSSGTPYTQIKTPADKSADESICTAEIPKTIIADVIGVKILTDQKMTREVSLIILVKNNPANTAWRMINLYADAREIIFKQQPDSTLPSEVSFCRTSSACDKDGECSGRNVVVLVQHGLVDIH